MMNYIRIGSKETISKDKHQLGQRLFIYVAIVISLLFHHDLYGQSPTITNFNPSSGPIGTTVTITGTNFSTTPSNNIVYFGATKATVTAATSTQLTVAVPMGATYQSITVQANGLTAYSSKPFIVTFGTGGNINACSANPKVDFGVGAQPYEVALGDLDGDGKADMVVTNYNSKTISVFRNTASSGSITSGSFAPKVDFIATTGTAYTQGVALGDIDGDGKLDIVVTNYIDNSGTATVAIFRNTSVAGSITSGSFATRVDFTCPGAFFLAIRDLDGDGKPEIAVATYFNKAIAVFRNVSTPGIIDATSLSPPVNFIATLTYSNGIAIDDIDGDGKPDLIAIDQNNNTVSVLRNTSTLGAIDATSFAPRVEFLTGSIPYFVTVGDLDNDQKPELVVSNYGGSSISIFKNVSTSGTITLSSLSPKVDFVTAANPQHIAITDFDGDGKPDLAVANSTPLVAVYKNTTVSGTISSGSFSLGSSFTTGFNPYGVTAGDLDGDGKPDLITANFGSNSVSVIRNAVLEAPSPTITSFNPSTAVIGTTINILGTNFSTTPANNIVKFNGIAATVTISTTTTITTTVPAGATTGTISITVGCNTATSAGSFIIGSPCSPGTIDSGGLDTTFDPQIQNPVPIEAVELQSTGKIIVLTQNSIQIGGTNYLSGLLRFNSDGSVDPSLNIGGPSGTKHQMLVQPDDKIIIIEDSGYSIDLSRLNADGTFDKSLVSFVVGTYSAEFGPIALQPDGKIIYTSHDTFSYMDNLTRLNSDGSSDPSLIAPTDLHVSVIKPKADGTILVGSFWTPGIYKLDAFGSFDSTFDPGSGTNNQVLDMAIQPDGKIIIVGDFDSYNGVTRKGIARLNVDGSLDNSFDPGGGFTLYEVPNSVLLQPDGRIIVGGNFLSYNGNSRIDLVRINPDGTLDCSFDGGPNINTGLVDIALQPNGKIVGVGDLTTYENTTRNGLVRVNNLVTSSCVPTAQRNALIALYNSTNGASWTNKTNWLSADESTWFGITVNSCNITEISLGNNNLTGFIPIEIKNLPNLTNLALSENKLSGGIPIELGNLASLRYLDLLSNQLTGTIPDQLGNITTLEGLNLSKNLLTGSIPISLGGLTILSFLEVYSNQLTGTIPAQLGNASSMAFMRLSDNKLTGTIPSSFGNLTQLFLLDLEQNLLTGPIPPQLGNLTLMKYMNLYSNQLTGPIPTTFGNLINLETLNIFTNQLSGTLPVELALCTQLKHLEVAENLFTGTLPIAYQSLVNLEIFQINNNSFTGPVPIEYLAWTKIKDLYLSNNQLDAIQTFPPALITNLAVENNKLDFGDLESNIGTTGYVYSPQAALPGGAFNLNAGSALTIPFTTSGTANQYQWFKNGAPIPGATSSTFSIPTTAVSDAGNYTVNITSSIVTGLTLSSLPFVVTIVPVIIISTQPIDFVACVGQTATFTTAATGTTNITYQWQYSPDSIVPFVDIINGGGYSNSNTSVLSINTTGSFGAGRYQCRINGDFATQVISFDEGLFINPLPAAPSAVGDSKCPTSILLNASGGTNGQYKWYTVPTGGTAIAGEVNSSYTTPVLTVSTTYYVAISSGGCESLRTPVVANILTAGCTGPVINVSPLATRVEGKIVVDLIPLITTTGILDVNSIKIIIQPGSGALATINNGLLTIDYSGKGFSGIESITIEACTTIGFCTQQALSLEVADEITVYNAVSPNGDKKNDYLYLQYIEILSSTKSNRVSIYNRWGDEVFSISDYDNNTRVFAGLTNDGGKLPAGTYFYKIVLPDAGKTLTGFIDLKY